MGTGAGRRRGQTPAPGQNVTTAQLTIVSDASFGMFIGVIYYDLSIRRPLKYLSLIMEFNK